MTKSEERERIPAPVVLTDSRTGFPIVFDARIFVSAHCITDDGQVTQVELRLAPTRTVLEPPNIVAEKIIKAIQAVYS